MNIPMGRLTAIRIAEQIESAVVRIKLCANDHDTIAVFYRDSVITAMPMTDGRTSLAMLAHPDRVVGVYTAAADRKDIAADLRAMLEARRAA